MKNESATVSLSVGKHTAHTISQTALCVCKFHSEFYYLIYLRGIWAEDHVLIIKMAMQVTQRGFLLYCFYCCTK